MPPNAWRPDNQQLNRAPQAPQASVILLFLSHLNQVFLKLNMEHQYVFLCLCICIELYVWRCWWNGWWASNEFSNTIIATGTLNPV